VACCTYALPPLLPEIVLHCCTSTPMHAGTPADKLLSMLLEMLEGYLPPINDILFMQVCHN
jgi:hypothetical protein